TLELHRDHGFGDQFRHHRPAHVHAEDAVGVRMRDHLHQPGGFVHRNGAAVGGEREVAGLVWDAFVLALLFGLAGPRDLGFGVDDPRDHAVIDMAGLAGDQFGDHHAFLFALVRQHRTTHAVADGPHTVDAGPAMLVHFDAAAIIRFHTSAVAQQPFRVRTAADRDQQLVDRDLVFAILVGVGDLDGILLHFGLRDLGAEVDVEALFLEFARGGLGDVGVGRAEEIRQRFQDRDFGAHALPHRAQFQADHARADHAQTLRHR